MRADLLAANLRRLAAFLACAFVGFAAGSATAVATERAWPTRPMRRVVGIAAAAPRRPASSRPARPARAPTWSRRPAARPRWTRSPGSRRRPPPAPSRRAGSRPGRWSGTRRASNPPRRYRIAPCGFPAISAASPWRRAARPGPAPRSPARVATARIAANRVPITSVICSAPSRPRFARCSESRVNPEMSAKTAVPSVVRAGTAAASTRCSCGTCGT